MRSCCLSCVGLPVPRQSPTVARWRTALERMGGCTAVHPDAVEWRIETRLYGPPKVPFILGRGCPADPVVPGRGWALGGAIAVGTRARRAKQNWRRESGGRGAQVSGLCTLGSTASPAMLAWSSGSLPIGASCHITHRRHETARALGCALSSKRCRGGASACRMRCCTCRRRR